MKVVMLLAGLVLALLFAEGYTQDVTATAVFNNGGITGWVRFMQFDDRVSILANLAGLQQNANWIIAELPVLTTLSPDLRATTDNVGNVYSFNDPSITGACSTTNPIGCEVGDLTGKFGQLPNNVPILFNDTTGLLRLTGRRSVVGRSVVVTAGVLRVAATIREKIEENPEPPQVTIATATLFSPYAGVVYFRETAGSSVGVQIYGKLYHTTGTATTVMHTWDIHENPPAEGYQAGIGCEESVGEEFNPFNVPEGQCSPNTPDQCQVGDLTTKHGPLTIDGSPTPYSTSAFFVIDTNLTLTGRGSVLGRSFILHGPDGADPITACAPIVYSENLIAMEFDNELLTMEQNSPYENSTLIPSNEFPEGNSISVYEAVFMTNGLCPADAAPYNPFQVTAPQIPATPDLFPLGDIPNKYNLEFFRNDQLELTELPVYGQNTLIGRTIRINKDDDVRVCSTLVPPKNEGGVLLKATYNTGAVQGGVIMFQNLLQGSLPMFPLRGQTLVMVDLFLPSGPMSSDHGWVITEQNCSTVMGNEPQVFNPFSVSTAAPYEQECDNLNQLRCQNGDMTGKHQALQLGAVGDANRPTYSFTDINLQLSSNYTVNGLYLAILGPNGDQNAIACTALQKLELAEANTNVFYSTQYTDDFDRVEFVNELASIDPLRGTLPPSNIVIFNEVVGATTVGDTPCATLQMAIIAPSVDIANAYAAITQSTLCTSSFGNDTCFRELPNYSQLCSPGTTTTESESLPVTTAGSPPLKGEVALLFGMVAMLAAWLAL